MMNSKKEKDLHFLEVDEDLRRIGRREAAKPLCPFGQRCYRKNPDHFKDYRHPKVESEQPLDQTKTNESIGPQKNKITDFFKRKPGPKKKSIETPGIDSDYQIEDDSDDDLTDKNNREVSLKPLPLKRMKHSPFKKIKGESSKKNELETSDQTNIEENRKPSSIGPFHKTKPIDLKGSNTKDVEHNVRFKESTPDNDYANESQSINAKAKANEDKTLINPKMTTNELNKLFKERLSVEMPKDFYQLWQFCKNIKPDRPEDAFAESLGLKLVGPFDILAGKVKKETMNDKQKMLCHWRYYYDLPEMQTIVSSIRSGYHLAYFRDTPEEENPVIVSNSGDDCLIEGIADNIFGAINREIQKSKSKVTANRDLKLIESKLKEFCSQSKIDLTDKTKLKGRKSKINAKTFNGFGIVVPYNKKTEVGYRPLPITDSELKKLLNNIIKTDPQIREDSNSLNELKEIFQLVSYANDECDFGMGLELGIDLFSNGDPFFHKSIVHLLSLAYNLLKRDAFAQTISAHMANRRKGYNLD